MTATQNFSDSQELFERSLVGFANLELFLRRYALVDLIGDAPRAIQLIDDKNDTPGQRPSMFLRWCNKRTGQQGDGVISLLAHLWVVSEFHAAKIVLEHLKNSDAGVPHEWALRRRRARPATIRLPHKNSLRPGEFKKDRCAFCGA